jgi:SAM-dependent methyltransferase
MGLTMNPDAYLEMASTEAQHWWFSGRRSIISNVIASLQLAPDAKILEIGSGTGGNLEMLSTFGTVCALEMDPKARSIALEKSGGRFNIHLGSCPDDIPFADDKFDLICLFDVLEHIHEDVETLFAIKRLLKEDGKIIITVPAYQWLWGAHDVHLHHMRRYTRSKLRKKVLSAGYRPTKLSYFNTLLLPLAAAIRLKDRLSGSAAASGTGVPPAAVNWMLANIFGLERFIINNMNLPFGVSLLCIIEPESMNND